MAVLAATNHVVRDWPPKARIALREAVLADVTTFAHTPEWDLGEVLIAVQRFGERWARGLPWPPPPVEVVADVGVPPAPAVELVAIQKLARIAEAIGAELALARFGTGRVP